MTTTIKNPTLATLRALLTAPPPALPKKARKAFVPATVDLRALTNTKPHTRFPYNGPPPKTPSAAAKLRRTAMMECECRLCALALSPPTTFAEYAALGLREPSLNATAFEREMMELVGPFTADQAARAEKLGVRS